jgi:hypothetical protein
MLGSISVPSMTELEQHYYELLDHRRKLEEMFDKTDKLLLGVRKGMDELRGGGAPQGPASAPSTAAQVVRTGSTAEKERTRESVWPIIDATTRE